MQFVRGEDGLVFECGNLFDSGQETTDCREACLRITHVYHQLVSGDGGKDVYSLAPDGEPFSDDRVVCQCHLVLADALAVLNGFFQPEMVDRHRVREGRGYCGSLLADGGCLRLLESALHGLTKFDQSISVGVVEQAPCVGRHIQ